MNQLRSDCGLNCGLHGGERVVLSRHLMYGAVRLYTPFERPESNDISPVSEDEDPFSICFDVLNGLLDTPIFKQ